ncbi:MAG: VWA domain-containing protein [bacterium]|nr:VWA domain-containing protein [bacterium]
MRLRLAGGEVRKKHAAAYAVNRLLHNTLVRCTKEDGVRPYFDVGVFGYGLDGGVQSVFERDLLSIAEIADRVKRVEKRPRQVPGKDGEMMTDSSQLPIWLEALADGKTVMNAAFERALLVLSEWISRHPDCFPPVVINITDGGFTDRSPLRTVTAIQQQSTDDGPALVFNCHLSEKIVPPVTFPGDCQAADFQKRMRQGYRMSSRLPALMLRHAAAKGYAIEPDARGYVFNADFVALIDFVEIGTRVIQDRME